MDLDELERLRGVYDRATKCTSLIGAERLSLILDARAMYETALFAAAQELVRDARRMEWAEANVTTVDAIGDPDNFVRIWYGPGEKQASAPTIREAIDSAIAQEQP